MKNASFAVNLERMTFGSDALHVGSGPIKAAHEQIDHMDTSAIIANLNFPNLNYYLKQSTNISHLQGVP